MEKKRFDKSECERQLLAAHVCVATLSCCRAHLYCQPFKKKKNTAGGHRKIASSISWSAGLRIHSKATSPGHPLSSTPKTVSVRHNFVSVAEHPYVGSTLHVIIGATFSF